MAGHVTGSAGICKNVAGAGDENRTRTPHAVQAIRLTRPIRPISTTKKWQTFKLAGTTNIAASCRSTPGMPPAC